MSCRDCSKLGSPRSSKDGGCNLAPPAASQIQVKNLRSDSMKILVVYWHPEPRSFNAAMFETICATLGSLGHEVRTSDLYQMDFDPVSSRRNFVTVREPRYFKQQAEEEFAAERNGFSSEIECEIEKVEWCDVMILQFPLWWFGLPAVLKGWVDRVFAAGRVHGNGQYYDTGVFRGKRALLSLTTGSA